MLPPVLSEEDQLLKELQEEVSRSDERTKTEEYLILPETVDGKKVQWKYGTNTRAFAILILGIGAVSYTHLVYPLQRDRCPVHRKSFHGSAGHEPGR